MLVLCSGRSFINTGKISVGWHKKMIVHFWCCTYYQIQVALDSARSDNYIYYVAVFDKPTCLAEEGNTRPYTGLEFRW